MTYRRIFSAVLVPVMSLQFSGCTKTVGVAPQELKPEETVKVFWTVDGQEVRPDRTVLRGDTIYAEVGDEALRFALSEVRGVAVKRPDQLKTVILVTSVAAFVAVVAFAVAFAATWTTPGFGSEWSWPSDSPFEY